ncbi:histidine kinase [Paenibacillus sp. HB172176]|uniref:sensor histidine kinase n=1 Tax=Paenibacillus sp. HB172176 TaxID=2493690 RepID=UPI00143C2D2D|nr:histidine kinase [Paenibacillus sp. HB172176]
MIRTIRNSLKWKLVVMITLAVLVIMTAVSLVNYNDMKQNVQRDVERFSDAILTQANLNLSRYYDNYESYFSLLSGNIDFSRWSDPGKRGTFDYFEEYRQTNEQLFLPISNQHPEIISLYLYNQSSGSEHLFISPTNRLTSKYGYSIKDEKWLLNIQQSKSPQKIVRLTDQYLEAYRKVSVPVLTMVQKFAYLNQIWFVKMDMQLTPAQGILSNIHLGGASKAMIIDDSGHIVAHPDDTLITTAIDEDLNRKIMSKTSSVFLWKKTNEMVVYQKIANTNWTTVVFVPYPVVAQSIFHVRDNTLAITGIGLILSIVLILTISTSATKRLLVLRQSIRRTGMGKLHHKLPELGSDEIGEVGLAYNRMLEQLEEMIQRLADTKINEHEAVQSALQSQIHSHFLYNALESINSLAHLANQPQIRQVTLALSSLLRYTSNYRDLTVTLGDELKHVRDYILIMRSIYGDDVACSFDIAADLEATSCLKAVLQPMVENAVKHGLETTGEAVHIHVAAEIEDSAVMRVDIMDNAGGFAEDTRMRLQELLSITETSEHYKKIARVGLLNVQNRLKLRYPDTSAGLSIRNLPERQGACITIRFPVHERREELAL